MDILERLRWRRLHLQRVDRAAVLPHTEIKMRTGGTARGADISDDLSLTHPLSYLQSFGVGGKVKICTVIGFPNGYSTTETKIFECKDALANGADEIDTVINIGHLKDKKYDLILSELKALKEACGDKILKVIIETCLLTDDEKIKMCEIVASSDADFIKTSTGFAGGGATREDVALLKAHCKGKLVKAAGGIKPLEDAEDFIALGADRLGSSRIVNLVKSK